MKLFQTFSKEFVEKITNGVLVLASFAAASSCLAFFHEEKVPKELQENNPFIK